MIKATTEHGTYYLIDTDNMKAIRVPAPDRGTLYAEDKWFYFTSMQGPEIGNKMYFNLIGHSHFDWIMSTTVVSIEEYDDSDSPS